MKAFVFPGQGSQYPGMGKELASVFPSARQVFEEADQVLGFSVSRLCFEGPQEDLVLTENTQPALLANSVAVLKSLGADLQPPAFVAGHSLGEYSALVATGALKFSDALRLVRQRGRFMQEAVPVGTGGMAAIIGLDLGRVEEVCALARESQVVSPANQNSSEQIAISGHLEAVGRACELALAKGAKRALMLPVSAPFHCSLMKPAEESMRPLLAATEFSELSVPLVNNVDAGFVRKPDEAREGLIRQLASMVRWTESIQLMVEQGVDLFVEIGAGRVLSGLIRRIAPQVKTINLEKPEQVEEYARTQ